MEFEEKTSQLEEVTIDKVCRTCLSTSDELAVTLFDVDEEEKTNFLDMITICFGKIVKKENKSLNSMLILPFIPFRCHLFKPSQQDYAMSAKSSSGSLLTLDPGA